MGGAVLMAAVCGGVGLALAFVLHRRVSSNAGWAVPILSAAAAALFTVAAMRIEGTAGLGWGVWAILGLVPAGFALTHAGQRHGFRSGFTRTSWGRTCIAFNISSGSLSIISLRRMNTVSMDI